MIEHPLDLVFKPRRVAVIGLSRSALNSPVSVLTTLKDFGYQGEIFIINPNMPPSDEGDYRVFAALDDISAPVDLAIVSVARQHVLDVLQGCARNGIHAAIVITQGFADADEEGKGLQADMVAFARDNDIRIVGPNTIGVSNAFERFTSSFIEVHYDESPIGIISQSGLFMMGHLLVNNEPAGFSMSIDLGNGCDIDIVDALEYYAQEDRIKVIQCHVEGIERGAAFIETAARVSRSTPIIMLKAGKTESGKMAVASHSGAAAGEAEVYRAAFRKAGIVTAENAEELRLLSKAFATYEPPRGDRVAIMSFSGGGAILAIDAVDAAGLALAKLSAETKAGMQGLFPSWLTVENPVDIWIPVARNFEAAFPLILELILGDEGVDSVICIYCSYTMPKYTAFDSSRYIGALAARFPEKPIVCWSYGMDIAGFSKEVEKHGNTMVFRSLEEATGALSKLNRYREFRDSRSEPSTNPRFPAKKDVATAVLAKAKIEQRAYLFSEALEILEAYGIETAQWKVAHNESELSTIAGTLRYPACIKVMSNDIVHKSESGGIVLDVQDESGLFEAYRVMLQRVREREPDATIDGVLVQSMGPKGKEVMVGARRDLVFGACMVVGAGGIYTELVDDFAFRIAPISERDAHEMIADLNFSKVLAGVRGEPPCDIPAVANILWKISQLVGDFPEISEIDVNPVIVNDSGALVVDARIIIA
jgi:acyl-CoA synthetase (NDP forming)